jgi:hypothetical protein
LSACLLIQLLQNSMASSSTSASKNPVTSRSINSTCINHTSVTAPPVALLLQMASSLTSAPKNPMTSRSMTSTVEIDRTVDKQVVRPTSTASSLTSASKNHTRVTTLPVALLFQMASSSTSASKNPVTARSMTSKNSMKSYDDSAKSTLTSKCSKKDQKRSKIS